MEWKKNRINLSHINYSFYIYRCQKVVIPIISEKQTLVKYNEKGQAENYQDVEILIKGAQRHFKKGEFYMQTFELDYLIMEKDYNVTDLKVLIALKRRLDFNNRIKTFRQVDIANEINSKQPNVSKSLKKLEDDKIILKDGLDYYFSDKYIKFAGYKKNK